MDSAGKKISSKFYEEKEIGDEFSYIDEGSTCRILTDFIAKAGNEQVPVIHIGHNDNVVFTGCILPPPQKNNGTSRNALNKKNVILRDITEWTLDRKEKCVWIKSARNIYYKLKDPHSSYKKIHGEFDTNVQILMTLIDPLEDNEWSDKDSISRDSVLNWKRVVKIITDIGFTEQQLIKSEPFLRHYIESQYDKDDTLRKEKGSFLAKLRSKAAYENIQFEQESSPEEEIVVNKKKKKKISQSDFLIQEEPQKKKRKVHDDENIRVIRSKSNGKSKKNDKKEKTKLDEHAAKKFIEESNKNESAIAIESSSIYQESIANEEEIGAKIFDREQDSCRSCHEVEFKDLKACKNFATCKNSWCEICFDALYESGQFKRSWQEIYDDDNWLCTCCTKKIK